MVSHYSVKSDRKEAVWGLVRKVTDSHVPGRWGGREKSSRMIVMVMMWLCAYVFVSDIRYKHKSC